MAGLIYPYDNFRPRIAASAWIAPTAVVIGDVEIGENVSIWYGCVLRGDGNRIVIGAGSNVQDGSIIHVNSEPGGSRGAPAHVCEIGANVTIGHLALIHACRLEDGAFVGMKACVMDGAVIEGGSVVAAGALVTPNKRVKRGELWAGSPAKPMRSLSEAEIADFASTAPYYVKRAQSFKAQGL